MCSIFFPWSFWPWDAKHKKKTLCEKNLGYNDNNLGADVHSMKKNVDETTCKIGYDLLSL